MLINWYPQPVPSGLPSMIYEKAPDVRKHLNGRYCCTFSKFIDGRSDGLKINRNCKRSANQEMCVHRLWKTLCSGSLVRELSVIWPEDYWDYQGLLAPVTGVVKLRGVGVWGTVCCGVSEWKGVPNPLWTQQAFLGLSGRLSATSAAGPMGGGRQWRPGDHGAPQCAAHHHLPHHHHRQGMEKLNVLKLQ